ncbi:GntR family transcriptional regulator [Dietzia maris]|jgi:DNA-binding transcriptional regulator YhcF (GntR family)|uniref:GntR family transcriptional regulator n=1 Tax=Dietzia maris TaxID=37915 RepID=A0A365PAL3_9ACTN|nr:MULTISPECIES: GntR family transcriptional regulator [Dietzia]MBB0997880.1 GntR family transcriptional regulator [Dietzia maris]MBB1018712.1 GntR family transcriptional regulator [Dietzia sp. DQ11-71]MCZ4540460.1 GntR family transcriptional regulator [Dietzia maris]MCZ4655279.1 GntR family transcriptional regulator [Dietzia kunjamensis]RBA36962.1 GntR family transcriptional regulator [Dietzia maris]
MNDPRAESGSADSALPTGGSRVAGVVLIVDPASPNPPFRQLKGQIVEAVSRGKLTAGTRLPAVRTLAAEAGISTATAAKVYRELEESGVLEGRGRSGTFVAAGDVAGAALTRAAEEFASSAAGAGFGVDDAVDALRNAFKNLG